MTKKFENELIFIHNIRKSKMIMRHYLQVVNNRGNTRINSIPDELTKIFASHINIFWFAIT